MKKQRDAKKCDYCDRTGHLAVKCFKRKKETKNEDDKNTSNQAEEESKLLPPDIDDGGIVLCAIEEAYDDVLHTVEESSKTFEHALAATVPQADLV